MGALNEERSRKMAAEHISFPQLFFFSVFHHTAKQVKEVVYLLEGSVRCAVKDRVVFCSSSNIFTLAVLS